jgi:hypothetical protein
MMRDDVAQTSVCGFPLDLGLHVHFVLHFRPGSIDGTPQTEVCATELREVPKVLR